MEEKKKNFQEFEKNLSCIGAVFGQLADDFDFEKFEQLNDFISQVSGNVERDIGDCFREVGFDFRKDGEESEDKGEEREDLLGNLLREYEVENEM